MATIEQITDMWSADSVIDMTELAGESIGTSKLHSKYIKLMMEAMEEERIARKALYVLQRDKSAYYLGTIDKKTLDHYGWAPFLKKIIKTELKDYLDADKDMQEASLLKDIASAKIRLCEEIIKSLHGRGYLVKNAIDWIKFQNGV